MVVGVIIIAFGPFIQFFDGHFSQKALKYKKEKGITKKAWASEWKLTPFTITIRT